LIIYSFNKIIKSINKNIIILFITLIIIINLLALALDNEHPNQTYLLIFQTRTIQQTSKEFEYYLKVKAIHRNQQKLREYARNTKKSISIQNLRKRIPSHLKKRNPTEETPRYLQQEVFIILKDNKLSENHNLQ